jgi:hypothetical protein
MAYLAHSYSPLMTVHEFVLQKSQLLNTSCCPVSPAALTTLGRQEHSRILFLCQWPQSLAPGLDASLVSPVQLEARGPVYGAFVQAGVTVGQAVFELIRLVGEAWRPGSSRPTREPG